MQHDRKKRPTVERTDPVRIWQAKEEPESRGASVDERPDGGRASPFASDAPGTRETSYKAINEAYRLIDEYVRQGQKMAENLWLPPQSSDDGSARAPLRFMRAMGDMTMAWVDVMQKWTNEAASPAGGAAGPFTAGRARTAEPSPAEPSSGVRHGSALWVSVKARGTVEVSVHLGNGVNPASLLPGDLRPFAGDAAPIRDVTLEMGTAEEGPLLRIVVPDDQPAGTYNGLLVDRATQRPHGTISLSIS